ncbi:MAG: NYN domain-containing protein [Armatimonadota bacterium]
MSAVRKRGMAFVDLDYVLSGFRELRGELARIDFGLLMLNLSPGYVELIRTYYYTARPEPDEEPKAYEQWRKHVKAIQQTQNAKVRLGHLVGEGSKKRQKGVDVYLALEMYRLARDDAYDVAILVSGDGDFVELVEQVQNTGRRVLVRYFERHCSEHLKRAGDYREALDELATDERVVSACAPAP